ncbi:spermidine/putrescine ABC transporter permease [Brevibacterium sp. Re57]|uniref:Spermidine/putrescine ABC transporter permease n=1 Tax=Brevibacterium gallinarum TaxID=2762220 RepID=A0ABR8WY90_9MICO|nr:spermidine/putrescine ABC transporter permease [Brevibacterium gallinarum]
MASLGRALLSPAATALAPLGLILAAFFILPLVSMAILAFTVETSRTESHLGFGNFAGLSSSHGRALMNSVLVSGVGSLIAAIVGALTALCIAQIRSKRLDSITAVFSSVLANDGGAPLAFSFIVTLGNTGIVFTALGLDRLGFSLYTWQGLVAMYQAFLIPTMIMVTLPTFAGLRREWSEANTSLGGTGWTFWRRVGFPVAWPSLLGGWVLLFGSAYATHASAAVLMGAGGFQLIPLNIAAQLSSGTGRGGEASAMALGVSMIVIAIATLVLFSRLQRRSAKWLS